MSAAEFWSAIWPQLAMFAAGAMLSGMLSWVLWQDLKASQDMLLEARRDMLARELRATQNAIRIRAEGEDEAMALRARLAEAARWFRLWHDQAQGARGENATIIGLARALRVTIDRESSPRLRRVR